MYKWTDIETALKMREEGFSISNIKNSLITIQRRY